MRSREWSPRLERQTSLTPRQREQVKAQLQGLAGRDAVSELLERITPTHCSTCRGTHLVRDGQADGLQRFKYRGCAVAFNGLTGSRCHVCAIARNGWSRPRCWRKERACARLQLVD